MTAVKSLAQPPAAVSPLMLGAAVGLGSAIGALCRFETGALLMAGWNV